MSDDDDDLNVNREADTNRSDDSDDSDEPDCDSDPVLDQGNGKVFDLNIPTTHRLVKLSLPQPIAIHKPRILYLGKLENISGYTFYEAGQEIVMLTMYTNTLVFPGYTLPMVIRDDLEVQSIYQDFKKGYTFALICLNEEGNNYFEYGVVMQVFENCMRSGSLTLKARGRQRCRICDTTKPRSWGRIHRVKVQILPDVLLPTPLANTQLISLKQKRRFKLDYNDYDKYSRNRKYHLAQFTHPNWVYDLFEIDYYMKLMLERLTKYYEKASIPTDPTGLSYWFAQNFQLMHVERLNLLSMNTTLERLRTELEYMNLERLICCGHCGKDIANQNKVFAMSKDGVSSNYVNPGGVVYETVTVTQAKNVALVGLPSEQFSWFPGYAWTIMKCKGCEKHLGWKFTAKKLQPTEFYGLALNSLNINIITPEKKDAA